MTPLKAVDIFIEYTRIHGSQHGITLHDLFFLQDFLYQDLEYCKDMKPRAMAIVARMNQESKNVKIIVDKLLKL